MTYYSSVIGTPLDSIDEIRVIATAIASYSYEWSIGIPLRNKN